MRGVHLHVCVCGGGEPCVVLCVCVCACYSLSQGRWGRVCAGVSPARARCPPPSILAPPQPWVSGRGGRERGESCCCYCCRRHTLQLKPLINQSYVKKAIHPSRHAARRQEGKINCNVLIYLFSSAAPLSLALAASMKTD